MPRTQYSFDNVDLVKCKLSKWKGDAKNCKWCNKPLTGRQRSWCSRKCSYQAVEQHVWKFARAAALSRDLAMCKHCGSRRLLEVNHEIPILGKHNTPGCYHHLVNLMTLCKDCHQKVTNQQRQAGLFGQESPLRKRS